MSSANSRQLSWMFLAEFNAADRGHDTPGASVWFSRRLVQLGADAVERGIAPGSPDAAEVLSALLGDADPATVLIRLRSHATHRVARYRELLAVVKGAGPEAAYRAEFAWGGRRAGGAHGRLI